MDDLNLKRKGDSRNLTDPNYAFGHYVNSECLRAGEKLVDQVVKERDKRKDWANKEIHQKAKEAAGYLSGVARGRLTFSGGTRSYNCFECTYKDLDIKDKHGQSLCGFKCNNGEYFQKREESDDQECQ